MSRGDYLKTRSPFSRVMECNLIDKHISRIEPRTIVIRRVPRGMGGKSTHPQCSLHPSALGSEMRSYSSTNFPLIGDDTAVGTRFNSVWSAVRDARRPPTRCTCEITLSQPPPPGGGGQSTCSASLTLTAEITVRRKVPGFFNAVAARSPLRQT
jgi:hypothetical protein